MSLKRSAWATQIRYRNHPLILSERTRVSSAPASHETDARLLRGPVEAMNLSRADASDRLCGSRKNAAAFVRVFGLPPQAMRRQVRRDAQLARDVLRARCPRSVMPIW